MKARASSLACILQARPCKMQSLSRRHSDHPTRNALNLRPFYPKNAKGAPVASEERLVSCVIPFAGVGNLGNRKRSSDGLSCLAPGLVLPGGGDPGIDVRLCARLRAGVRGTGMLLLTAVVTL